MAEAARGASLSAPPCAINTWQLPTALPAAHGTAPRAYMDSHVAMHKTHMRKKAQGLMF